MAKAVGPEAEVIRDRSAELLARLERDVQLDGADATVIDAIEEARRALWRK